MKKTLKSAGAVGLAAATILTGLSFGPAAASATPAANQEAAIQTKAGQAPLGQFVLTRLAGGVNGINTTSRGTRPPMVTPDKAAVYSFPQIGEVSQVIDQASGLCLTSLPTPGPYSTTLEPCTDAASQLYTLEASGALRSANPAGPGDHYMAVWSGSPGGLGSAQQALNVVQLERLKNLFRARIADQDVATRTATITGTGVPGAAVIINGNDQVFVTADGSWSYEVTGLVLGKQDITIEHFEGAGDKTAEATVPVDLAVSPVTATTTFDTDVTKKAVLSGTAHPGATVVVEDATGTEIDRAPVSPIDGTWSLEVTAPNLGGAYPVTVHQLIDGERNGEISQSIAYGAAVEVTRPVPDAAHDGGPLAMRGTGEPRAQLLVREQGHATVIGSGDVLVNGTWNLATSDLDARKHVLEVTQTGKGGNVTTSTITINPEAETFKPLTVETPENGSTVTTSRPVFTGHGQDGASVTIGYGATAIGTTTVVDGDWTITPTRGLGMGVSDLTVTQDAGGEVSTLTHTLTRVAAELPLAVTSHVDGQTYAEGMTTFRGTAPAGSTIRATNQWGTPMGTATATDGTWSFKRTLGPTTAGYDLTFTATPPVGAPQTVSLKLNYAGALGFEVTSPVNDSTYTVGTTTFTGTAMPGTVVTATNQWNTPMGRATAGLAGTWAFDRYLGPTSAGYDITFVATKGTDTQRTALHLATAVVNVPVDVTSITDGATYRPGLNVLTGTGTPGATVEAVNATNGWNVPMGRATVKPDGTWALPERNWGPSNDYAVQVTQTNPDKTTSTTTVNVKAPVFAPLVLTSPAVGDTYDTGVAARFEGTATPFATVSVRSAKSDTTYRTVEADADGHWSFTRVWGPTHDYVLNIDQKARNGQSDSITGFAWNHSGN